MLARRMYVFDSKSAVECPLPLSKFVMAEGPCGLKKKYKESCNFLAYKYVFCYCSFLDVRNGI